MLKFNQLIVCFCQNYWYLMFLYFTIFFLFLCWLFFGIDLFWYSPLSTSFLFFILFMFAIFCFFSRKFSFDNKALGVALVLVTKKVQRSPLFHSISIAFMFLFVLQYIYLLLAQLLKPSITTFHCSFVIAWESVKRDAHLMLSSRLFAHFRQRLLFYFFLCLLAIFPIASSFLIQFFKFCAVNK